MEKPEQIMKAVKEKLSGLFSGGRPMSAREKWLILLLGGVLLALVLWPQSGKSESGEDSEGLTAWGISGDSGAAAGSGSGTADSDDGAGSRETADTGSFGITGSSQDYADALSQKLTAYLSQMDGAGQVTAWVTVESGEQSVLYEEESSQTSSLAEADSQGGTREETTENVTRTVVFGEDGNPYVVQTSLPKIQGVLVLAEGGDDSTVRLEIVEAVEVLFGLDAHKIKVVKKKAEE
ncbi:MAG: hypothetical protein LUH19_04275 [Lachnospiraceae bacterium]|nr:hypothetical protein [Lachnospiraceae bacterium]